jgi:Zn-dependent protease with chaperone function
MTNNRFFSRLFLQNREMRTWWDIRKVGFKKRLVVLSLVIISTTFYVVLANPLVRIAWLLVFFVSAELFTFIYTPTYLGNLWLRLTYKKKTVQVDIPEEIVKLLNQIGVRIKELRIHLDPNFRNAYVVGRTVVVGLPIIKELNVDEGQAVVAHELGHIKENHSLARFLVSLGSLLSLWSWFGLPFQILAISSLAYFTVVMIPFIWIIEYRADQVAIRFAGGNNLKSALLKIADKKNLKEPSEDHPSIFNRLKLIEQSKS